MSNSNDACTRRDDKAGNRSCLPINVQRPYSSNHIPEDFFTRVGLRLHPRTNGYTIEQIIALNIVNTSLEPITAQAIAMTSWIVVGEHFIRHLLESVERIDEAERYRHSRVHPHNNDYYDQLQGDNFDYKQLDGLDCVIGLGHDHYAPFFDNGQAEIARIHRPIDPYYNSVMHRHQDNDEHTVTMYDQAHTSRPRHPQSQWRFIQ